MYRNKYNTRFAHLLCRCLCFIRGVCNVLHSYNICFHAQGPLDVTGGDNVFSPTSSNPDSTTTTTTVPDESTATTTTTKSRSSGSKSNERREYNMGVLRHVQVIFAHLACSKLQYYVPRSFWKHFRYSLAAARLSPPPRPVSARQRFSGKNNALPLDLFWSGTVVLQKMRAFISEYLVVITLWSELVYMYIKFDKLSIKHHW